MQETKMQDAHANPDNQQSVLAEAATAPVDNAELTSDVSVEAVPTHTLVESTETASASEIITLNDGAEPSLPAEVGIDIEEAKRALEAVLLAASEPMPLSELKRVFAGELAVDTIRNLLDTMKSEWVGRSAELVQVASGYRFRVLPTYQKYLDRLTNEKPPKYSRAVLETLAIIAYRQPVTRGDIEDIRGVAVSPHILKTLEDRGWIEEIGHRETVGRPVLFATTKHFLDDLNLVSLEELPPLHELQATLDMSQAGAALGLDAALTLTPLPAQAEEDSVGSVEDIEEEASASVSASANDTPVVEPAGVVTSASETTTETETPVQSDPNALPVLATESSAEVAQDAQVAGGANHG